MGAALACHIVPHSLMNSSLFFAHSNVSSEPPLILSPPTFFWSSLHYCVSWLRTKDIILGHAAVVCIVFSFTYEHETRNDMAYAIDICPSLAFLRYLLEPNR